MRNLIFVLLFLAVCTPAWCGTPSPVFTSGLAKFKAGDYKAAITYYNDAITQEPDVNYYYYHRANAKYKLNDLAGAISDLNTSIGLEVTADALYLRGLCNTISHNYTAASADLEQAYELRPDQKTTCFYLGVDYYFLSKHTEAISMFDKAVYIDRYYYDAYLFRGLSKFSQGKKDEGIKDVLQCLSIKGDYPQAMFELAKMYWETRELDLCKSFLDMAIELKPNFQDAMDFRSKNFAE